MNDSVTSRARRILAGVSPLTRRATLRGGFLAAAAGWTGARTTRAAACYPCRGRCVPLCGDDCPAVPARCRVFPADHVWNVRVDHLPVHPRSDAYVDVIGRDAPLHPDFGPGLWDDRPMGIPFDVSTAATPARRLRIAEYPEESDPGLYRIPVGALVEGGDCGAGDRHVLVIDETSCELQELYHARPLRRGRWSAGSAARWDLNGYRQRPEGWTSADAAGLPILPGLVRYDEVAAGEIAHALRFTVERAEGHVWPATHWEPSDEASDVPAMGHRFRLKADVDVSRFAPEAQVILVALKRYGMMIADHGSPWFLSGVPDERWNGEALVELQEEGGITGDDFECVDASPLMISHDSARARV